MEGFVLLLTHYGTTVYVLLFGYCAVKSGWLPLFAGYAAFLGALDIRIVALVTFLGGFLGDEIRFSIARAYGVRWLEKTNLFGRLFNRARFLAQRYGTAYIFVYRYPKGLRTIGALPMGLTDMSRGWFTLLNASSATLWVAALVGSGYVYGRTFDSLGVENLAAISFLMLFIFLIALYKVWRSEQTLKTI